jgi:hypothetical protein
MKLIKNKLRVLALAAGSLAITMAGANAANSFYTAGDLVLYCHQEGGTNTVYVDLGNAATVFRGTSTGADAANALNLIDISAQLNAAFGASWATATNLYMGVAGFVGTSNTSTVLTNSDPQRTLYVGQSRDMVGAVGSAQSTGYTVNTDAGMSSGSTGMQSMIAPFADATGANGYNAAAVVSPSSVSAITTQNPFLAPGIQGDAFNSTFAGGVQQVGTAGTFAASFGAVSNVEFAVDLYRIQAKNTLAGQVGFGEPLRAGTYEGTVTLDSAGSVSFQTSAVPEPATYALFGSAALVIGFVAVRRRKLAEKNA